MATIINSISFQNFYNYFGSLEDNQFHFTTGINIISADNNMGKSKFYNGILWLLKDQVYDSDEKRFKPVGSSFVRMASSKARSIGCPFTMAVKIIYSNGLENYEVVKSVHFTKDGNEWIPSGQILDVIETSHGVTTPIYDTAVQTKVIEGIIPVQLRDYALLQGESMEEIVDLSSKEGLQSTIETLADIGDVVRIRTTCSQLTKLSKQLYNDQQSKATQQDKDAQKLIQERMMLEERVSSNTEELGRIKTELSRAEETKGRIEAMIDNASSREKYRSEIEITEKDITRLIEEKKRLESNITIKLFTDHPWLLLGHNNSIEKFDQKRLELSRERTLRQVQDEFHKGVSTILLPEGSPDVPSLRRMLEKEVCEVCGRPAIKGSEAWLNIKKLIDRPKDNTPKMANQFDKFFGNLQINSGSIECDSQLIEDDILHYRQKIDDKVQEIENRKSELNTIRTRFLNAGGSTHAAKDDQTSLSDYQLASDNIIRYHDKIKLIECNIDRWNARIAQINGLLSQKKATNSTEKYAQLNTVMACIEQMFEDAKERIFDRILETLKKNANEKYKDLLKGNPVEGGTLTFDKQPDGTVYVSIKNAEDGELTGLGTGFQRMKQLSIIMAIISTKIGDNRFDYPFISDAPFSEFGDNFIKNFFRIAPNVFTQSIIMVKDLYDVDSPSNMNTLGMDIYNKMKSGEIPGSFYVNYIEERSDVTSLVTKTKKYI